MKPLLILVGILLAAPGAASAQGLENFKSITGIPAFESLSQGSVGMSAFFNQLYVLSVGAAAVIALAQIMIAGFLWAYSRGNHSTIQEARSKIQNSILGLLLVLSPTIVFGVINPEILNLKINLGLFERNAVEEGGIYSNEEIRPENVVIARDEWGQVNGACYVKFNDDATGKLAAVVDMGRGNDALGRACCRLMDGEIDMSTGLCDLENLMRLGRYALTAKLQVAAETENPVIINGVAQKNIFEVFVRTSGIDSVTLLDVGFYQVRDVYRDNTMFAIHGFRNKTQCEAIARSPKTIERMLKNPPDGAGLIRLRKLSDTSLHHHDNVKITPELSSKLEVLKVLWSSCERHEFKYAE